MAPWSQSPDSLIQWFHVERCSTPWETAPLVPENFIGQCFPKQQFVVHYVVAEPWMHLPREAITRVLSVHIELPSRGRGEGGDGTAHFVPCGSFVHFLRSSHIHTQIKRSDGSYHQSTFHWGSMPSKPSLGHCLRDVAASCPMWLIILGKQQQCNRKSKRKEFINGIQTQTFIRKCTRTGITEWINSGIWQKWQKKQIALCLIMRLKPPDTVNINW